MARISTSANSTTSNATALYGNLNEPVETLQGIRCFRAGDYSKFGKGNWPVERLQSIVDNYDPQFFEAPIVLDHQEVGPAFGKIANPRLDGDILVTDLTNVPCSFAEAVRKGRYDKLSVRFSTDIDGNGTPYLKHLSFLGAQAPQVKGLVNTFSEDSPVHKSPAVEFEFSEKQFCDSSSTPPQPLTDPNPKGHGVITQQCTCHDMADHYHQVYLDDKGNGFTSPPLSWNRYTMTDHQHAVKASQIESEGDIPHVHRLIIPASFSESQNSQEGTMPEATLTAPVSAAPVAPTATASAPVPTETNQVAPTPTAPSATETAAVPPSADTPVAPAPVSAPVSAPVIDLATENERLRTRNAELEAASRITEAKAQFNDTWNECVRKGQVLPADYDREFFIFANLTTNDVTFSDAATTPRGVYIDALKSRGKVLTLGASGTDSTPGYTRNTETGSEASFAEERYTRAKKYHAEHPDIEFADALIAVDARRN